MKTSASPFPFFPGSITSYLSGGIPLTRLHFPCSALIQVTTIFSLAEPPADLLLSSQPPDGLPSYHRVTLVYGGFFQI